MRTLKISYCKEESRDGFNFIREVKSQVFPSGACVRVGVEGQGKRTGSCGQRRCLDLEIMAVKSSRAAVCMATEVGRPVFGIDKVRECGDNCTLK